jgi:hypothetical protein
MTSRTRLLSTVAGVGVASLLVAYLIWHDAMGVDWPFRGLSLAAAVLSVVTAFRAEFFVFDPVVVGGSIWWVKGDISGNGPHIALPLQIVNRGYGEGVIEWLALTVKEKSWPRPYPFETVTDLDPQKLFAEMGNVNAASQKGPFTTAALGARSVASFTILFAPSDVPGQAIPTFGVGDYEFVCYLKVAGEDGPRAALEFSKDYKAENLERYKQGQTQFFPNTSYRVEAIVPE